MNGGYLAIMNRIIYVDNAATTPLSKSVLDAMMPFFTERYGNASSLYSVGRKAKRHLELARESAAQCLGAHIERNSVVSEGTTMRIVFE